MWARIESGIVVEMTDIDPDNRFHESMVWAKCDKKVDIGWRFDGGKFLKPEDPVLSFKDVQAIRQAAYRNESDPMKNEADYDALISGDDPDYRAWMAKIAEIKARYPLPADVQN